VSLRATTIAPAAALALSWALATTVGPFADTTVNDLFVYRTYADLLAGGRLPYRDFGFEYPPLAAIPIWLAGLPGRDEGAYAVSFAVLMAGCALAGQWLAARLADCAACWQSARPSCNSWSRASASAGPPSSRPRLSWERASRGVTRPSAGRSKVRPILPTCSSWR